MTIEEIFGKLGDSERRDLANALLREGHDDSGKPKPVEIRKVFKGGHIEASAIWPLETEDVAMLSHMARHAKKKRNGAMDGILEGKIHSSELFKLMKPFWHDGKDIEKIKEAIERLFTLSIFIKYKYQEKKWSIKEYRKLLGQCHIEEDGAGAEIGFAVDKSLAQSLFAHSRFAALWKSEGTSAPFETPNEGGTSR